jgi:hypothetical protein
MLLAAAFLLLAQSSDAGGVKGPSGQPAAAHSQVERSCPAPSADSTTIVICTERPQGYRLNPDVMEAKREIHGGGRPVRQSTETPPPECATVGPFPCFNAGINLIAAAATAAEMAARLGKGEEIGSMFMTDPHPDEYHLYLMAKARREAEEARKAADKKAKVAAKPQSEAPAAAPAAAPPRPAGL